MTAAAAAANTAARDAAAWYVCRHEHEGPLLAELADAGIAARVIASGLVATQAAALATPPVWALQVAPAIQALAAGSIQAQAHAVADALAVAIEDAQVPIWLHVIVPGDLRGNPKPPGDRRRQLLTAAISERMRAIRRRSWRLAQPPASIATAWPPQALIAQLFDLADGMWLSVAGARRDAVGALWPSAFPCGHAPVADDRAAPASSFRKLAEALGHLDRGPAPGELAVDLGAAPGGWTHVLRRHGARVIAVDRAPLAAALGRDPGVRAVAADAFRFRSTAADGAVAWLVSDIVAFPPRIIELLGDLSSYGGAEPRGPSRVVVQMKFRGAPDVAAIAAAQAAAAASGYDVVARHLFHDKNEVTFCGRRRDLAEAT